LEPRLREILTCLIRPHSSNTREESQTLQANKDEVKQEVKKIIRPETTSTMSPSNIKNDSQQHFMRAMHIRSETKGRRRQGRPHYFGNN
jgi:hypothetical protein